SSITVDRKLLEGSGFLAGGQYSPGVQVEPETHKCIHREVEIRDAPILSSMRKVYHHFRGRAVTIEIAGGWFRTHRVFFSEYIKICENRYVHIPTREPIIVLELACAPDYMPWLRIHDKPYLLSEEYRRRQIHVERERRGRLNPRRKDDGTGP
ncbi:hypothetical protein Goklo_008726, partial [Gossypium klotzschianum]|nr:hypothetical protein [Gossypium klotzschianum]